MITLGLDIGTTSLSAVVLDTQTGGTVDTRTVRKDGFLPEDVPGARMQDAEEILHLCRRTADELLRAHPDIAAIGLTGQMHGIVYTDGDGKPVSPLYTWQDGRAAFGTPSTIDAIRSATGYRLAPGYGLGTHAALMASGGVPGRAERLSTIMDCAAADLCGVPVSLMHASDAASFGLFLPESMDFDERALEALGIDRRLLPRVTTEREQVGTYRGIPVYVALGDNQASFLGSVSEPEKTVLCNFGTGSQVSVMVPETAAAPLAPGLEYRPYLDGKLLLCGSGLCGGKAWAMLESFFRQMLPESGSLYERLNTLALAVLCGDAPRMEANTAFCGTRTDPTAAGSFSNVSDATFTPGSMAAAVLLGMCRELWELYRSADCQRPVLMLSGNAARRNPALAAAAEQVFSRRAVLCPYTEEAARGAALFAGRKS